MAAMAMEREGDVSRFIDTYKFDQQREDIRQKYGGGTSLPLHSDGLEDRRQRLREERRQEMLLQQEKQRQLEQQKLDARQRSPPRPPVQAPGQEMDYQASHEQARAEDRRYYQDYMGKYHSPNTVLAKPPVNYEENRKVLNEERKREYNMLMEKKAKEERERAARGRTVTPPGGLDIGQYDRSLKENAQKRKNDYREILVQQQAEQLKQKALDRAAETSPRYMHYRENERPLVGSPRDINFFMREKEDKDIFRKDRKETQHVHDPYSPYKPQTQTIEDPNIRKYYEVERDKAESKRRYREELLKQQKEHMYLRARQEPEIPVIDRAAQQNNSLASKPPPGPGFRPREDAFQTDSLSKPSERPAHGQPPYPGEGQRQTDISKLFPIDDARRTPPPRTPPHQFEDRRPNNPQTELTGRYSPSRPNRNEPGRPGSRDRWNLQRPAEPATTLLVGTSAVDSRRREGSQQRKQEYREYLERKNEEEQKKRDEMHQRAMSKPAEVVKNQYYSSDSYEHYQKDLHRKQSEEYRDFLNKQKQEQHSPYENFVFPTVARAEKPMVENMGDVVEQRRQLLREERKRDYERYQLQQKMKDVPRRHDYIDSTNGPFEDTGIFARLGDHGNTKDLLRDERKNEYLQHLEKYSDRGRSPMKPGGLSGPPVDHYQQMLNEKRREEAQHRRFDDPEFQDRYQNSRENQRYNY